jgi:hypothetical protein
VVRVPGYRCRGRVPFSALPHSLRSSGSERGPLSLVSTIEELHGKKCNDLQIGRKEVANKGRKTRKKQKVQKIKKIKLKTNKEKVTVFKSCNIEVAVMIGTVLLCRPCHHIPEQKSIEPDFMVSHSQTIVHFSELNIYRSFAIIRRGGIDEPDPD